MKGVASGAERPHRARRPSTLTASSGPVTPPTQRDPLPLLLYVVAAVAALIAIFGPPTISSYMKRNNTP